MKPDDKEPFLGQNAWVLLAVAALIAGLYVVKDRDKTPDKRCTTYPTGVVCKIIEG